MPSLVVKPYNKLTYAFLQNGYIDTEFKFKVALNRMPIFSKTVRLSVSLDKVLYIFQCPTEELKNAVREKSENVSISWPKMKPA